MVLRPFRENERFELADLIYASLNTWYRNHGRPPIFRGGPRVCRVYAEVYNDLTPDANVVAVDPETGRLMGSCFYHPRPKHVGLGVMNVHPNYFGLGVGARLLKHIMDYADQQGLPVRLTQSAVNVDSFSLYNKAGFVPRYMYQDMFLNVPPDGMSAAPPPAVRKVRDATLADVPAMAAVEMDVSGITRELDYQYCIENRRGYFHASVIEGANGALDGFMISVNCPAKNMLGPCVARTEEAATALIWRELDVHRGRAPVFLVPMDKQLVVRSAYDWGARNCEMHFCQVRGGWEPFRGVNMPTFMPETG